MNVTLRMLEQTKFSMYKKCLLFVDKQSAEEVLLTDDPERQQAIGRNAKGYNRLLWEGARQAIALRGILAKFEQNEDLKNRLLETGDDYLVECAGKDTIWACGIRINDEDRHDASKWKGTNILGFSLMEVRSIIRANREN